MSDRSPVPRLLMNRLRHLMAEGGSTRERLDQVVRLIAFTLVADVCSIYVRSEDAELVLIATEGLRPEAVTMTRLRIDEGLVGQIAKSAKSLAIQDAPRHPAFSYRPETGEDPYHAFLGVPILRSGRVIGVLTVQNRTERAYGEEEIETLETIAMVLAEVLAGEATGDNGLPDFGTRATGPAQFRGRVLCPGLGMGIAALHDPVVPAARFFALDPEVEEGRLLAGLATLRRAAESMVAIDAGALMGEPREVLETYRMLANDPAWADRLLEGVRSGLTAEAAVDRARREHRARMEQARDPYLRERLYDLEDLDNRLLRILGGAVKNGLAGDDRPRILVARRLGPADLLEYGHAGLTAILLEEASASSHAAIVARALGIPSLGGLPGLVPAVEAGDPIIVDAEQGTAHVRPDKPLIRAYESRVALRGERQAAYHALRDTPAVTKDGTAIRLMLNAGLKLDADHLTESGASGIGLFRTEFQFLVSETLPRLGEQVALYREILDLAGNRPVIFRTLDLGGDKMLPNLNQEREENPALGWRSIRFALDQKGLFRRQLRALVRASAPGELSVMFPMVTTPAEFMEARALLQRELDWTRGRGLPVPGTVRVGAMLEVPALAYGLGEIAPHCDFISLGTNDLLQFFFAADRMTPRVAERYGLMQPQALRFLREVAGRCADLGLQTSVCGEATGHPLQALCLIALGYRQLSMPASGIGPVKQMVRSLDLGAFKERFVPLLESSVSDFRKEVLTLVRHAGVDVADN